MQYASEARGLPFHETLLQGHEQADTAAIILALEARTVHLNASAESGDP